MSALAYWFGGAVIACDVELPLLPARPADTPSARIAVTRAIGGVVTEVDFDELVTDGRMNGLTWRFGRTGAGEWAFTHGRALTAVIDSTGTDIHLEVDDEAPADWVSEMIVTWILVYRSLALGGWCFHGSAVAAPDGRGIAFLGPTGGGKSTMVAAGVAAGGSLLADDSLMGHHDGRTTWIDNTATDLKLRDGARTYANDVAHLSEHITFDERLAITPSNHVLTAPLSLVVFLGPRADRTDVIDLTPADAFGRLLRNSKVGLWSRQDRRDDEFDAAQAIAGSTQCIELRMPTMINGDRHELDSLLRRWFAA